MKKHLTADEIRSLYAGPLNAGEGDVRYVHAAEQALKAETGPAVKIRELTKTLVAKAREADGRRADAVAAVEADSDLSRDGRERRREAARSEATEAIGKIAEEMRAAVQGVLGRAEQRAVEAANAGGEVKRDETVAALRTLSFQLATQSLDGGEFADVAASAIEGGAEHAPELVEVARLRLRGDKLHLDRIDAVVERGREAQARERIAGDPERMGAGAELYATSRAASRFETIATHAASGEPGALDVQLADDE